MSIVITIKNNKIYPFIKDIINYNICLQAKKKFKNVLNVNFIFVINV